MSATDAEHLELPIAGMTCASCANRVERKLNKLDGVTATVNYATEKARVEFDPGAVGRRGPVGAVEAAGYAATLPPSTPAGGDDGDGPRAGGDRGRCAGALLLAARAVAARCWCWRWSRRCSSTTGSGCR